MTYLTPDGEQKSMPLKVLKSKKALTGKEQALQMIEDLPIRSKEVLVVCFETRAVNSGTGKVGVACFWYHYQELSEAACFVVMCRLNTTGMETSKTILPVLSKESKVTVTWTVSNDTRSTEVPWLFIVYPRTWCSCKELFDICHYYTDHYMGWR